MNGLRSPLAVLFLALLFVPLERVFALRAQKLFRPGWRTDLAHMLFDDLIQKLVLVVSIGLLVGLLEPFVSARVQNVVTAQPQAVQVLEALLISDLIGYWFHRAFHRVPWLWRIHAVHHSSEQLDWLASVRVHPLDQAITRSVQFIPLYLMGFSALTFGASLAVLSVWAVFLHANVRLRFGPLKWLFSTPEFHHWHHARGVHANFSALFPIVDVIFRTVHLPRDAAPSAYGSDAPVPARYHQQLAFPFTTDA